jgi:hypothetical protein
MHKSLAEEDHGRIGANAVKRSESIIEDFHSIGRHLNRLENERARDLSAPVVPIEEGKSEERTSISLLWISGKI